MSKITADEQLLLRSYPQASRLWLGVQQGVDILTAEVDGAHAEGATEILLKNVVAADLSDLIRGMTISFGIPQVADRRVSAVFLDYDDGTNILTIGANAEHLVDNENVTIYSAMKLWRLDPPEFDGQKTPPFAIMGSARAGFVNEPIKFVGEFSYSPVGRTLTDYSWKKYGADLVNGSLALANTEDDPLILSWDTAGEHLVRLKVEDSAGEVAKSFRPVLIFEREGANAPYADFTISNFRYGGGGWSADIAVYGVADQDLFPREALIVIWAEDYFAGDSEEGLSTQGGFRSIGGQYRGAEEVVYTGWVRADTVVVSPDGNSVRFTMESVEQQMHNITMPSYTFRDTNAIPSPTLTAEELTEDTDNYSPTDFDGVGTLNISSDSDIDLTGLAGGFDGRRLKVINVGANTITLKDESMDSSEANRFDLSGDHALAPSATIILYYDGTAERWQVNNPNETAWTTFDTLTLDKAALHIVQQETTLPLMSDVFCAMFGFQLSILDVPSASLYDQLAQSILQACFGYTAGSRYGSLTLARHRNRMTREMRAYLNTASIMFSSRDWMGDLEISGDAVTALARELIEGRLGDDTPVLGKYPLTGPSGVGSIQTESGYLFYSQAQADEAAQVVWRDANRNVKGANLRVPNYRMLEPAFEEYATIILLASENSRGFNWDNTFNGDTGREVLVRGMSMDFADGAFQVQFDFAISVYGAHGREWDVLDPAPVRQFAYGYGQAATSPTTTVDYLLDSDGNMILDSEGNSLAEIP